MKTKYPDARRRKKRLYIYISDVDAAKIKSRAKKAGLSISSYGRNMVLFAAKELREVQTGIDIKALKATNEQLNQTGRNLKQAIDTGNTGLISLLIHKVGKELDAFRAALQGGLGGLPPVPKSPQRSEAARQ